MLLNDYFQYDIIQDYLWKAYGTTYKSLLTYFHSVAENIILWIVSYYLICALIYILSIRYKVGSNKIIKGAKRALFVIAHPDDECMFFGPSILNFIRQGIEVHILCLSVGNYEKQGVVRQPELWKACAALGIKECRITLYIDAYMPDDPGIRWPTEHVADIISTHLEANKMDTLVTFDKEGVSRHPNHSSIFYAVALLTLERRFPKGCRVFTLDSVNIIRKYWGYLDLPLSYLLSSHRFVLSRQDSRVVVKAMKQHQSQMLWFRHLYLLFSRFVVINTLKEVSILDVELDLELDE